MIVKKEYIIRNIAGQDVIVATGKAALKYKGLLTVSPSGRFILENYSKAKDIVDLIHMVLDEFEVDIDTATKDVIGFTKAMLEQEIIEFSDPEKNW